MLAIIEMCLIYTMNAPYMPEDDLYLFNEGTHLRLFDKLGSHRATVRDTPGFQFSVWAPNAKDVFVIGDFNDWNASACRLSAQGSSGIWSGFVANVHVGQRYKYSIVARDTGKRFEKADPFAFGAETPPATASVVVDLNYQWQDESWMSKRKERHTLESPISIYEMHLGSWMLAPNGEESVVSYRGLAPRLVEHIKSMGFTHVEFLPVMEHPFYGSWGYQTSGYFAPTRRYGPPEDFMFLIDYLHQNDIGVLLDWVPSHFVTDAHALGKFDGTALYEHADPKQGFHPDWKSFIFNYGRNEVRSFLLSNAIFWLEKYHIDGLRVDAVASMLYLDYSRKTGEWVPNVFGGRENLEAVSFLKQLNEQIYKHHPDTITVAEESTSWPKVSRPLYDGGLGFGYKWDMGWMHDTLSYMEREPIHRKHHQNELTFRSVYTYSENFVLPLSHDEVVQGKGSLLEKMPGDDFQKFANLRVLLGYQFAQPGKKLLFMGCEFGQRREWNHDQILDWDLLQQPAHAGIRTWVQDLNRIYTSEESMSQGDAHSTGFRWIDGGDFKNSVISFLRIGSKPDSEILVVCNLTPVLRSGYRIGVPHGGYWKELLNSDSKVYGGTGAGNNGGVAASEISCHGLRWSISLTLPPQSILFLKT